MSGSDSSGEVKDTPYVSEDVVAAAVNAISHLDHVPNCVGLEFNVPSSSSFFFVRALHDALESALMGKPTSTLPRLAVLHDSHCCPGIVAARRIQAELILHFGPTCCCFGDTPCPVVVLPNPFVKYDEAAIATKVSAAISEVYATLSDDDEGKTKTVLVSLDGELAGRTAGLKNAVSATLSKDIASSVVFCEQQMPSFDGKKEAAKDDVVKFAGWSYPSKSLQEQKCGLVYVGSSRSAAFAMEVSVPAVAFRAAMLPDSVNETDDCGDDDEIPSEVKAMISRGRFGVAMRRSRAIEDLRSADSVGILFATPAHANNARAIQKLALDYGLSNATLVAMDRITEYKLSVYPEDHIGVFVVVACPYTLRFLESRRYDRPVVSAAECVYAFTDDDEWVSHYTTDAATALSHAESH